VNTVATALSHFFSPSCIVRKEVTVCKSIFSNFCRNPDFTQTMANQPAARAGALYDVWLLAKIDDPAPTRGSPIS
jgi:hypothetical protein